MLLGRISLARALYSDHEVILLDDPLSAVDVHVGEHIFEHTICRSFAGKTIIFVTHQLQYLSACDQVLFVHDGGVDVGKHTELMTSNEAYKLLQSHHNREAEEMIPDEDDNAEAPETALEASMSQYKNLRRNLSKVPQAKKQLKSELLGSKSAAGGVLIKVRCNAQQHVNLSNPLPLPLGGNHPERCCRVGNRGRLRSRSWRRVSLCWHSLAVRHCHVRKDFLRLLPDVLDSGGEGVLTCAAVSANVVLDREMDSLATEA